MQMRTSRFWAPTAGESQNSMSSTLLAMSLKSSALMWFRLSVWMQMTLAFLLSTCFMHFSTLFMVLSLRASPSKITTLQLCIFLESGFSGFIWYRNTFYFSICRLSIEISMSLYLRWPLSYNRVVIWKNLVE